MRPTARSRSRSCKRSPTDYGFTLKLYPVAGSQMQNQTSLWLESGATGQTGSTAGLGAMNPTALKEASKIDFPMNRLVGVWWAGGEDDVVRWRTRQGLFTLNFSGVGQNFPAIQDILKYVVDKGKSQITSRSKVGENLYNRGVMNAVLIAEAIRAAQQLTGKKQVSGEDVRRGLETLKIPDTRWTELGLPGFAAPISPELRRPQRSQWHLPGRVGRDQMDQGVRLDRTNQGQGAAADRERGSNYVSSNAGWPKRTEACDKSS